MIKNLLPEDTRLAELGSALILIATGISLALGNLFVPELFAIHITEFWVMICMVFGSMQLLTLMFYPRLELLRCIMALASGSMLIWFSLITSHIWFNASDISLLCVGLMNMYSFIINATQIRSVWEK